MCYRRDAFANLRSIVSKHNMQLPNGQVVPVEGMGTDSRDVTFHGHHFPFQHIPAYSPSHLVLPLPVPEPPIPPPPSPATPSPDSLEPPLSSPPSPLISRPHRTITRPAYLHDYICSTLHMELMTS
ncbi:hypothetical protein I3760_07G024100 [Carya illinoinensis]|nr:hypothetical protein I3760_07G024100 [Carya illinoinensis]